MTSFIQYLNEQQSLDEMAINPSSLNRFLASDIAGKMTLGIEAEMIMPIKEGEGSHADNSDAFEVPIVTTSVDAMYKQIKDLVNVAGGDFDRIEEELDNVFKTDDEHFLNFYHQCIDQYTEKFAELAFDKYEVNGKSVFPDIFNEKLKEYLTEEDDIPEEDVVAIEKLYENALDNSSDDDWSLYGIRFSSSGAQREFKEYLNAHKAGNYSSQIIWAVMSSMDDDVDALVDEYRDGFDYSDAEDWYENKEGKSVIEAFFDEHWITTVMDLFNKWIDNREIDMIMNSHTEGNDFTDSGASADYYAEELATIVAAPVGVNYHYHGYNTDRMREWTLEPDSSIGDYAEDEHVGIEFISPPIKDLEVALDEFEGFFSFINQHKGMNNSTTGFHINLSLPFDIQQNVDFLKLMLLIGDQHVLSDFNRSNNRYAQSTLKQALSMVKSRESMEKVVALLDTMKTTLVDKNRYADNNDIQSIMGRVFGEFMAGSKFVSINVKNSRYIEFRGAGGEDYAKDWTKLKLTILRFAYVLSVAADINAEKHEYMKKLYKFMTDAVGTSDDPIIGKFIQYVTLSAGQTPERVAELRNQLKKILVIKKEVKGGKETSEQWVKRIMNTKEVDISRADMEVMAGDSPTELEMDYRRALMGRMTPNQYGRLVGNAWNVLHNKA